jgi:hypothetical protein
MPLFGVAGQRAEVPMPMSKEDMKIWLDKADDKDAESIERAKNFVERVKTLGLSEC